MSDKTAISIIIPHYNNVPNLSLCLGALSSLYKERQDIEILVVDNGSTDDLVQAKKRFSVIWLEETTAQSPYACRNRGIQKAKGEIIILLDTNCIPLEGWLESGLKKLHSSTIICAGQLKLLHSNDVFSRFDLLYSVIHPADMKVRHSLPAGNLFLHKKAFKELGFFTTQIRSLGDIEWTNRAYHAGYQLCLTDEPIATYQTKKRKEFISKMIRLGKGKKQQFTHKGGRVLSLFWVWSLFKTILPPNPSFVKRMLLINQREATKLTLFQIICLCWLTKILRGYGMFTGLWTWDYG